MVVRCWISRMSRLLWGWPRLASFPGLGCDLVAVLGLITNNNQTKARCLPPYLPACKISRNHLHPWGFVPRFALDALLLGFGCSRWRCCFSPCCLSVRAAVAAGCCCAGCLRGGCACYQAQRYACLLRLLGLLVACWFVRGGCSSAFGLVFLWSRSCGG